MIDGIGGIGYDLSAGGLALGDNNRRPRLFKITAGSNPYTASEVVLLETDGSKSNTGIYDVTAAQKVLWEVNGNTSVPVNTIVEATPNAAGLGFYFGYASVTQTAPQVRFAQQSGTFLITAASGVWQDVFTTTSLPSGSYLMILAVDAIFRTGTVGDYIQARIVSSGGTEVFQPMTVATILVAGVDHAQTVSCVRQNSPLSGDYKLQVRRVGSGPFTTSLTLQGLTTMTFIPVTTI